MQMVLKPWDWVDSAKELVSQQKREQSNDVEKQVKNNMHIVIVL
jgi:hypothetical protein